MLNLKSGLRHIVSMTIGRDADCIGEDALHYVDVISFDVFDTLVYRCCAEPGDVFDLVERRFNRTHGDRPIEGFRLARDHAESEARQKAHVEEVTLEEIYREFPDSMMPLADELMELEKDTEIAICRPVEDAKRLVERAKGLGKRVVATSDMYLPADTVSGILSSCGYEGFERVFVSSEYGVTKRSGRLFERVADELGFMPEKILHFGDHPINDFASARKAGVRASLVCRRGQGSRLFRPWAAVGATKDALNQLEVGVMRAIACEGLRHEGDIRGRFGYAVLGPMLYGYSVWLHGLREKDGGSELWFLSREGDVLRRAYDVLYPGEGGSTRYVNVSRVALCRPAMASVRSYGEMRSLLSCLANSIATTGDLLSVLGLESDDGLARYGLTTEKEISECDGDRVFRAVAELGGDDFRRQEELATRYLEGCDARPGDVIVCDIGWAGTMQGLLQKLMPGRRFAGAYFAVSDFHDTERSFIDRSALDRRGFWCDSEDWGTRGQAIRFVQSAAETLFLNSEGTTLGYRQTEEGVMPVKDVARQLPETSESASILHKSALAFVSECASACLPEVLGEVDGMSAMLPFLNAVTRGSGDAVRFYKHFKFIDGARVVSITAEHGFSYYLRHPKAALAELEANNSKVLWLKGVFKVPSPYYRMLRLLTSGLGMESEYARAITDDGAGGPIE